MPANFSLVMMKIFAAVYDLGSVVLAARTLRMSQSGVSTTLAKLRVILDDQLFISTSTGMQPTARARELIDPVREMIVCIDRRILGRSDFDPRTATREFTIALSDVAEAIYMPRVLNAVNLAAPHVRLRSVELPQLQLQRALSEGQVDLALGYLPDLVASEFVRRKVGQHSFVCICSADNKRLINAFNLKTYCAARHVVVEAPGRTQGLLERYMQQRGIERHIVFTTPHFMCIAELISQTDMLASVPKALAESFSEKKQLIRLDLPFRSPVFETHLHWSKSVHNDPAIRWLREILFNAFSDKGTPQGVLPQIRAAVNHGP